MEIRPVPRHKKVTDWVLAQLRDAIVGGRLKPNTVLHLHSLAEELGVSTTPIREALLKLEEEGVVRGNAHRSFRVALLSLADIRDFHHVHAFLAGELAARACERLTEAQLADLHALDSEIEEAATDGDYSRMHDLNFSFHKAVNKAAPPTVLHTLIRATSRYVSRRTFPDVPGWLESASEHTPILSAFERRDSVVVRKLMEEHVRLGGERLINNLRSLGGWAEERNNGC